MNVIKKLVLELDGKRVELTTKQAKELFESLEELFGKKLIRVYEPYRAPYIPVIPYKERPLPYIWCGTNMQLKDRAYAAAGGVGSSVTYNSKDSTLTCKLGS